MNTIGMRATTLKDSFNTFTELIQEPKFLDAAWKLKVDVELATWEVAFDEAMDMEVPPLFKQVHTNYTEALSAYSLAADAFARGIDSLNADSLQEAKKLMETGGAAIRNAATELEAIVKEKGWQ